MSDVERAIAQIADIRARMAASSRFRGYAPESVALLGVLSVALTVLEVVWPDRFRGSDSQLVRDWGLLLAGGGLCIAAEAVFRTMRETDAMVSPALLSALRGVIPGTLMAVAVAAAVLAYVPQACWIVPGTWQMLIGMATFASYPLMPRKIAWPGAWFLLSGALGLFLAGRQGGLSPLLVGVPFFVGHFGIAWTLFEKEPGTRV